MAASVQMQPLPESLSIHRRRRGGAEVALAFEMNDNGHVLRGLRLSQRHVVVADDGRPDESDDIFAERRVSLSIPLSGFDLVLALWVAPDRQRIRDAEVRRYTIVHADKRTSATLAQLVRAVTAGWLPRAEDLAIGWDDETPMRGGGDNSRRVSRLVPWLVLGVSGIALAAGIAVLAAVSYESLTSVHTEAAAVTAPRYDIVSGEYGTVAPGSVPVGSRVIPGQALVSVLSDEVGSAIDIEKANVAYYSAPHAQDPAAGESASERDRQLTLAQNRLRALERRQEALSFRSTCNCMVIWTAPAQVPVAPGALLMSMVSADDGDVRIEALLTPDAAASVHSGQYAAVTLSGSAVPLPARVEALRYENSNVPRVGLGDRGNKITVVLKLDGSVDGLTPGTPANVVIRK